MPFSLLPTVAVVVAAWAGSPAGPHAPGDGMRELRKIPPPPIRQQTALPAPGADGAKSTHIFGLDLRG